MAKVTKGHCACKAVKFEFRGDPLAAFYCHCKDCQRAASAPAVAWIRILRSSFRFVEGQLTYYNSSPGVRRGFCGQCGSPLYYESDDTPSGIDLYAISLEDTDYVVPERHVFVKDQLRWFEIHDHLPRYTTTKKADDEPVRWGPRTL